MATNGDGSGIVSGRVAMAEQKAKVIGHVGKGIGSSLVNVTCMQAE